jgi:primosomal protein N' (replication factor Y)
MPAARVLIDGPSERVRVPLRNKLSQGTVLDLVASEDLGFALRSLHSLSDPEPLITAKLLEAGRWIANYYGCSIESVIRALLPEAVRTEDQPPFPRPPVRPNGCFRGLPPKANS